MIFTIINVCLKTYLWSQYLFPLAEYDDGIYLYFLQLCILYKYWYFIPLFTKETYLSVADSLFIINYEMKKIIKPVEIFYLGCMAIVRLECKFFLWETQLLQKQCSYCTSMASDVTMMLFLMTMLLLNSIKNFRKKKKNPLFWASGFHLSVESLEWNSLKFGVCIQVSQSRFDSCLAAVTFPEDMTYLLLNCSFPFSHPTWSYKIGFTPRPMQLILRAAFIYHQHIAFWVNPLSVLSDACLTFWLLISK